jgi:hypothetical protein
MASVLEGRSLATISLIRDGILNCFCMSSLLKPWLSTIVGGGKLGRISASAGKQLFTSILQHGDTSIISVPSTHKLREPSISKRLAQKPTSQHENFTYQKRKSSHSDKLSLIIP